MYGSVPINSSQKKILVVESWRKELMRGLFILLLIANTFLFLRFFLKLVGANPESFFAGFVFLVSGIFMLPFFGIIIRNEESVAGHSVIDGSALLAMFCYLVLILLAVAVVQIGAKIFKIGRQTGESIQKKEMVDSAPIDDNLI